MKVSKFFVFCALLSLFMAFSSCVKDNVSGQENAVEPSAMMSSDFVVSSLEKSAFQSDSDLNGFKIYSDTTSLEQLGFSYLKDELNKISMTFLFKNSLNKDFNVQFEFLNESDKLQFSFHTPVSAGSELNPSKVETSVVIEIPELATFKEATKMVYKVVLQPMEEEALTENEGSFELYSTTTRYFDF